MIPLDALPSTLETRLAWLTHLQQVLHTLHEANIAAMVTEEAAQLLQGIEIPELAAEAGPQPTTIEVQWDGFPRLNTLFSLHPEQREKTSVQTADGQFLFRCIPNTVVLTKPLRTEITLVGTSIPVEHFSAYQAPNCKDLRLTERTTNYLTQLHRQNTALNQQAWTQQSYEAWVERFGEPASAAEDILIRPQHHLGSLYPLLPPLQGCRVLNPLGSHGRKAVALAALGADVTVVDISEGNARYARELAQEAGVSLRYLISDILNLPEKVLRERYDLILMEMGVLHYFVSLTPLFTTLRSLLRDGGCFLLQEFHPISTKLISSKGKKHKVTGNYFSPELVTRPVAFRRHLGEQQTGQALVYQKDWTLGEVVTAIARSSMQIQLLQEDPNMKLDDLGLPKTYTLLARV